MRCVDGGGPVEDTLVVGCWGAEADSVVVPGGLPLVSAGMHNRGVSVVANNCGDG
jgi:hypothetical protein